MAHLLLQGGGIEAGADVHAAVQQHAAHALGEQARIPGAEPGAIGIADVMQLALPQQRAQQIHVTRGGVGVDMPTQRIAAAGLGFEARVAQGIAKVLRAAVKSQMELNFPQFR
ncbi:hypothetical protein D3C85_1236590 [compost metagenome]